MQSIGKHMESVRIDRKHMEGVRIDRKHLESVRIELPVIVTWL